MQCRATEEHKELFVLYIYHRSLLRSEVTFLQTSVSRTIRRKVAYIALLKCIVRGNQARVKNTDVRHPSSAVVMHRHKSASPVHNVSTETAFWRSITVLHLLYQYYVKHCSLSVVQRAGEFVVLRLEVFGFPLYRQATSINKIKLNGSNLITWELHTSWRIWIKLGISDFDGVPLRIHELREIRLNGSQTSLKGVIEILPPFSNFELDLDKIYKYVLSIKAIYYPTDAQIYNS